MLMIGGIRRGEWKLFLTIIFGLGGGRMFASVPYEAEDNQSSERRRDQEQL